MIRENGKWEAFKMIMIKEFPCENRLQACAEEDKIMLEVKATLNDIRASRSRKQYRIDNYDTIVEKKKQYHIDNRDKIIEKSKQYHLDNRDTILDYIFHRFDYNIYSCDEPFV